MSSKTAKPQSYIPKPQEPAIITPIRCSSEWNAHTYRTAKRQCYIQRAKCKRAKCKTETIHSVMDTINMEGTVPTHVARPDFVACSHVVGESNVLLRNTRAVWLKLTKLTADDHELLRSYGCEFHEIHDCCIEINTSIGRKDVTCNMQHLTELQQCLDSAHSLLRSHHNAQQANDHLSNVLSLVAHEGLCCDPVLNTHLMHVC